MKRIAKETEQFFKVDIHYKFYRKSDPSDAIADTKRVV